MGCDNKKIKQHSDHNLTLIINTKFDQNQEVKHVLVISHNNKLFSLQVSAVFILPIIAPRWILKLIPPVVSAARYLFR